jgi:hypothetical protein
MKDDEFLLDKITYEETYDYDISSNDLTSLDALLEKEKEK